MYFFVLYVKNLNYYKKILLFYYFIDYYFIKKKKLIKHSNIYIKIL